ncbi:Paraneoplastic antigen Ma3 homolog [Lemmus lemmus]
MGLAILLDWCRLMGANSQRSLLILGIPDDCEEEEFQEALQAVLGPLGRYRVLGKIFRKEIGAKVALVEFADNLNQSLIPQQIPNDRGPWTVIFLPRVPDSDLQDTFNFPAQAHGQALEGASGEAGASGRSVEEGDVVRAAQTLGAVMQPLLEQMFYRELRVFSGNTTSIPGLLTFDSWLEHTTEMLQMWQVPEVEKRRRLVECLQGPALQVVNVLRANNSAITVKECLEALKQVFGPVESRRMAQMKFCKAYQEPGEKVSSFVVRLEALLQKALEKRAIARRNVNQTRLKRILGGATLTEKLREKLTLMKQRRKPPGFLALVRFLREEEEWEATMGPEDSCAQGLETGPSPSTLGSRERALFIPAFDSGLEKRPYQGSRRRRGRGQHRRGGVPRDRSQGARKRNYDTFCYSCGEDGHIRVHCLNPSNRALVKQKRRAAMEMGNGAWAWDKSHPKPKTK